VPPVAWLLSAMGVMIPDALSEPEPGLAEMREPEAGVAVGADA